MVVARLSAGPSWDVRGVHFTCLFPFPPPNQWVKDSKWTSRNLRQKTPKCGLENTMIQVSLAKNQCIQTVGNEAYGKVL